MKNAKIPKGIKIKSVLVFIFIFLVINGFIHMQFLNQKNAEKLKAAYTAESTVERIEAQLNKYFSKSDLLKKIVESGHELGEVEFDKLSGFLQDDEVVIEAIELAQDGVVSQVYPLDGNEEAIGLDMLENSARKTEARLAMNSEKYTIAGPYELVQGGTGALLFDPIYTTGETGEKNFWGFSILVINWEEFIDDIQLEALEDAAYHYRIWKMDMSTGEKLSIAECGSAIADDALEVVCDVPNDNWHFEIVPAGGWISNSDILFGSVASIVFSLLVTVVYWQFEMRRYKEAVYTAGIKKAAREAKSANEAKTRFLFNMSHDIRTPLNAVIGFADLLKEHLDDRAKVEDYVDKIRASGSMLLSIINHVLEMARIESGKTALNENVTCINDIADSLQAVFEPSVHEKELICNINCNVTHEYVICDETKVREIFLNIIGNSVKYTPKGGRVRVDIVETDTDIKDYASFRIVISDTGIGMSKEYLPHIFEEFTREHSTTEAKVDGTGLGLPIVKALLDLMKGTIDVKSEPGKGTTTIINLSFPVATKEQIKDGNEQKRENLINSLKGKRLLLAEDNDLNAEIAMTILNENGIEVERAEDGRICVDMLKAAREDYYDGILMDIQMPNMNGYDATEEIRKLRGRRGIIPIIAMTANAFEEDRKKAFVCGMNAHIVKPIDVGVMLSTLGKFIV